ncbi:MAG TPA: transcription-repair coupling factor [Dehalococcoidia bacterium]|nr:transcription-repair coupling factor [Dehalococcoidia bacterium]
MNLSGLLTVIEEAPSLARLRAALAGDAFRLVVGVADTAKAAALAALLRGQERPVVLVTSRPDRAAALAEELAVWLGEPGRVLLFPERDPLPYERLAPDAETVRDRLRALDSLRSGRRAVIVVSALALAQRTLSPREAGAETLVLRAGQPLAMDGFLAHLAALGYSLEPLVQQTGEASRRGGIIDVFPPTAASPLRIELLGREVESLRWFDPQTQRSVQPVEEVEIGPAREAVWRDRRHETRDTGHETRDTGHQTRDTGHGTRDTGYGTRDTISGLDFSGCPAAVRERFQEEVSFLREGVWFEGDYFWVPFLAPSTLLERAADALVVVDEEAEVTAAIEEAQEQAEASRRELEERGEIPRGLPSPLEGWPRLREALEGLPRRLRLSRWATGEEEGEARLPFGPAPAYGGQLRRLVNEAALEAKAGGRFVIVSQQAQRLAELLAEEEAPAAAVTDIEGEPPRLAVVLGSLPGGWRLVDGGLELTLATDTEVFGFAKQRRAAPRKGVNREAFLAELRPGDYVVHVDHGIARFSGMVRLTLEGHEREYLELHYAEGDKLFVPSDQLERVSRYVGPSEREPHVTRLASGDWQRAKERVRKAVRALARELLALYAAREVMPGHACPGDTPWQAELEASFPYVETADQLAAIGQVKRDMEAPRPMDRLVCGDVGYGKTEVAIRAAFKAVLDGRQVAVLVPTTVLAQQHYETFRQRLSPFPVRVEVLSRLRTDVEQRQTVAEVAAGTVDVVIGTHRLLQKDVAFKELGLVVIDEEQRFGVAHKEHLKRMRREVDVLTLSATPIPRTLHMALGGIRDMSTMETPPEERLPIKTYVSEFDERLVREAVVRELERDGQVYLVHNRVHNIELIASKLQETVPEATVAIAHGQMDEQQLARTMAEFVQGRIDVLVCTTIIESGLDIPNVNTIIVNQADRLGLGQLYQLRGRVGRGAHRAYAYLLYDRKGRLTEAARQRLQTIFEATELGAGFQIALRDLEIRGAGNLLGAEQSGFMAAVGFDLYCRLLADEVERMRALLRGETPAAPREGPEISIELPLSAHLPQSYVADVNVRLALYQRLSGAGSAEEVSAIGQEMVDRFGAPPLPARNLLYVVALRTAAAQAGVQSIGVEDGNAVARLREGLTLSREELEGRVPRGVQVGRTLLRVELGEGWRERLRRAMEEAAAAQAGQEAVTA